MRVWQALIILLLTSAAAANAATITAASCSSTAVQAAINSAAGGDTVVIPDGSCTWTSGISIKGKGLIVRGSSSVGVTITNNVTTAPAISVSEDRTFHTDVSNLSIIGNSSEYSAIAVTTITTDTPGMAVLIHDIVFTNSRAIRMYT